MALTHVTVDKKQTPETTERAKYASAHRKRREAVVDPTAAWVGVTGGNRQHSAPVPVKRAKRRTEGQTKRIDPFITASIDPWHTAPSTDTQRHDPTAGIESAAVARCR